MSRSSQKPRRDKVNLCFVTSDPSSGGGKTNNLHIVRSHAGKWRWSEARKKKTTTTQEKAAIGEKFPRRRLSISEELDASDTSAQYTSSSGSKDSSPDDDLDFLFSTLEEEVSIIECPEEIPPEEVYNTYSTQMPEPKWPTYCNAGTVNVYGITPNILDPFQQYPHTSPLPSELVSNANKYCKSPGIYDLCPSASNCC